jgi:hypothetical protein
MSSSWIGHVQISDTPTGRFPVGYKRGYPPPPLIWPLRWLKNPLNLHFLNSNSLSLNLQSNPCLLGEIWANSWVTLSIFKRKHITDNLCVFVTLENLSPRWTRCPLGATKVVVSLGKFVLPSPLWWFDSGKLNLILVIVRWGLGLKETRPFVSTSMEM